MSLGEAVTLVTSVSATSASESRWPGATGRKSVPRKLAKNETQPELRWPPRRQVPLHRWEPVSVRGAAMAQVYFCVGCAVAPPHRLHGSPELMRGRENRQPGRAECKLLQLAGNV